MKFIKYTIYSLLFLSALVSCFLFYAPNADAAYRSSSTNTGSSATPSVAVPSGVQAGDIVILVATIDYTSADFETGDWPTGFTELSEVGVTLDGHRMAVGWKRLTGSDSGSYTFGNLGNSFDWVCQAFAYSGRHATNNPEITSNTNNSGNTSPVSVSAASITAVAGDDLLWISAPDVSASGVGNGHSAPGSYTEREDSEYLWSNLSGADRQNVSAGATGNIAGTFSLSSGTSGWAAFLVRMPLASTPKSVYYSVGQTTADLKTGAPTLTISGGVATFSTDQTGNIGVGDRVTYNTSTIAYISGKTSPSTWTLVTKTGGTPPNVGSAQTVNSITREYTSLSAAEAGAYDANHLGFTDLATNSTTLNFPCYFDTGPDTTAVAINGWTTSAAYYIRIYTPTNTSTEANFSQRHDGRWNESKYQLKYTGTSDYPIQINEENVRIDGLQIYQTNIGNPNEPIIVQSVTGVSTIDISNNLVRGAGDYDGGGSPYGILAWEDAGSGDSNMFVYNNVVFDYYGSSCAGIYNGDAEVDLYAYNNTIDSMDYALVNGGGLFIAKNNLIQKAGQCFYNTMYADESAWNICGSATLEGDYSTAIESGNTDGIGTDMSVLRDTGQNFLTTVKPYMLVHNTTDNTYEIVHSVNSNTELTLDSDIMDDGENYEILPEYYVNWSGSNEIDFFRDDYAADYRLTVEETVAKNAGENVYADTDLPVTTDLEGQPRPSSGAYFDIGADEALNQVYYSVGQNTSNHETGAGTVTVTGTWVIFSVPQTANNMGVGDMIDYGASNSKCYIYGKISETEWTCVSATGQVPTQASGATVNSVSHAFSSLAGAITGATGPNYLNTSNLTLGNYQLNFPCYYDTGPDTTFANVDGYTTAQNNFIRIYTPIDTNSESNQSQRHSGKWDEGKYRLEATSQVGFGSATVLKSNINFTKIEGLQMKLTDATEPYIYGLRLEAANNTADGNIIVGSLSGSSGSGGNGVGIAVGGSLSKIYNNIIYNWINSTNEIQGINTGDVLADHIYNNTIYNVRRGIYSDNSNVVATNNIIQNCTSGDCFGGNYNNSSDYNLSDNVSDAPSPSYRNGLATTVSFVSTANKDFHLSPNDTGARKFGKNLSNDYFLPFNTDIDGHPRSSTWDIGADESSEAATSSSGDLQETASGSGLVFYHPFDGDSINWGGAMPTSYDQSGQGNDGTIVNGASAVIGRKGQALNFDGTDDFLEMADDPSLNFGTGSFTVSAWVNLKTLPGAGTYYSIVDKQDASMATGWHLSIWDDDNVWFSTDDGTTQEQAFSSAINANTWYHIVAVFDRANADQLIYLNGAQSGNIPDTTGNGSVDSQNGESLLVGSHHPTGSGFANFPGKIDEVRIYNRALNSTEIAELYKVGEQKMNMSLAGKNTNGLVGHWTFDGAYISGNTALDASGNGKSGSIYSAYPTLGKKGQALSFTDGSTSFVDCGNNSITGTSAFTLSAWMKTTTVSKYSGAISIGASGTSTSAYIGTVASAQVGTSNSIGGGFYGSNYGTGVTATNQWSYVVMTFAGGAGGAVKIYVDGTEKVNTTSTPNLSSTYTRIGRICSDTSYDFNGAIDDVRIYNRVLSADEVGDLYRLGGATMGR